MGDDGWNLNPHYTTDENAPRRLPSQQAYGSQFTNTYDRYSIQGQSYSGQDVLSDLGYGKGKMKIKIPRNFQRQSNGEWYCMERDGSMRAIGKLAIYNAWIINPSEDFTFDALYCVIGDEKGTYPVVIAYEDLYKRNQTKLLRSFRWDPNSSETDFITLFYYLLYQYPTIFFSTPKISGWSPTQTGEIFFASSDSVNVVIEKYYPSDVKERKLHKTERALEDIAREYVNLLPQNWKYKLLVAIRVASLLLYFFDQKGLKPRQLFVLEQASEANADVLMALTRNQDYEDRCACSLLQSSDIINKTLAVNDGIALFRENSLIEDKKKITSKMTILLNDLQNATGKKNPLRHLIAVISKTPALLPDELPAYYINFDDSDVCEDARNLQRVSGEFDYALIQSICRDPLNNIKKIMDITEAIMSETLKEEVLPENRNTLDTYRIILSASLLLVERGVITNEEYCMIQCYLQTNESIHISAETSVVNEFRTILNQVIQNDSVKLIPRYEPPYYALGEPMAFVDKEYINFDIILFHKIFLPQLKMTDKKYQLLSALKEQGILHSRKEEYYRYVDAEVEKGRKISVQVYSVPKSILDAESYQKLNAALFDDYFFSPSELSKANVVPLIGNEDGTKVAGVQILLGRKHNFHVYVSGKTRYGKTYFLAQQAVFRANMGEKVIIFDNNGSFTYQELCDHLDEEVVQKYMSFYDISEKIPVDLFSLEHCKNLPEKCDCICSILSAATKGFGSKQETVIAELLEQCIDENTLSISAGAIRNNLSGNEQVMKNLRHKLNSVLMRVEHTGMETQTWNQFLNRQKQIVVITADTDSVSKGTQIIDMFLASFYHYKVHNKKQRFTVIVDEIKDLNLTESGTLNTILRKSGKYDIIMLLASQDYSEEPNGFGQVIGNTGMKVFFKPKDNRVSELSGKYKIPPEALTGLEQGECYIDGDLYCKSIQGNRSAFLHGKSVSYQKLLPSTEDEQLSETYIIEY